MQERRAGIPALRNVPHGLAPAPPTDCLLAQNFRHGILTEHSRLCLRRPPTALSITSKQTHNTCKCNQGQYNC